MLNVLLYKPEDMSLTPGIHGQMPWFQFSSGISAVLCQGWRWGQEDSLEMVGQLAWATSMAGTREALFQQGGKRRDTPKLLSDLHTCSHGSHRLHPDTSHIHVHTHTLI